MANRELPTIEMLHKLLICDAEAGKLFWRVRPSYSFAEGRYGQKSIAKSWNKKHAGKKAFDVLTDGYLAGAIYGNSHKAHRIIYAMHYGEWPKDEIDHINHNKIDNRIVNLRIATRTENNKNQTIRTDNKSGFCGVYWREAHNKWYAQIRHEGKNIYLGGFDKKSDAVAVREKANVRFGFHTNHGK